MKPHLPLALIAVAAFAGVATAAPTSAPSIAPSVATTQSADAAFAHTDWDDDSDDGRRYGPMPRPDIRELNRVGIIRVTDVERDDGHLEVEGRDAQGREIEVRMDIQGQRVLSVRRDRDDDRDDDDRWDDRWDD